MITAGVLAGALSSTAGCGGLSAPTTTNTPIPPTITLYSGTLPVGGSVVQPLTVTQASIGTFMLASLAEGSLGTPLTTTSVGVALGTSSEETGCTRTLDHSLTPALRAQITSDLSAIPRCLEIYDPGTLTSDVTYAIRVVLTPASNAATNTTSRAGTETFSGILPVLGSATRTVNASQPGLLSSIVTSATPPNVRLGFGLGIPRIDGAGCHLTMAISTVTSAATPISSQVDAGTFCVRLFDVGNATSTVNFTISTAHP
jgi:hypothetical protein